VVEKTASMLKEISVNRYHSIYCDREVFAILDTHSGTYSRRLIYSGFSALIGLPCLNYSASNSQGGKPAVMTLRLTPFFINWAITTLTPLEIGLFTQTRKRVICFYTKITTDKEGLEQDAMHIL
jgi:hypothetical protein